MPAERLRAPGGRWWLGVEVHDDRGQALGDGGAGDGQEARYRPAFCATTETTFVLIDMAAYGKASGVERRPLAGNRKTLSLGLRGAALRGTRNGCGTGA